MPKSPNGLEWAGSCTSIGKSDNPQNDVRHTSFNLFFQSMGENSDPDPEMTSRQRREANLGVVLISISILFIACQSVKIIPDVYEVRHLKLSFL